MFLRLCRVDDPPLLASRQFLTDQPRSGSAGRAKATTQMGRAAQLFMRARLGVRSSLVNGID
jgi:hypothetical protein